MSRNGVVQEWGRVLTFNFWTAEEWGRLVSRSQARNRSSDGRSARHALIERIKIAPGKLPLTEPDPKGQ